MSENDRIWFYLMNSPDLPAGCYNTNRSSGKNYNMRLMTEADFVLEKGMSKPHWKCIKNRLSGDRFNFSTIQDFLDTYDLMI